MSQILNIYESLLSYSGMRVGETGEIYSNLGSNVETVPVTIDGLPLVFPTREQFDSTDQEKLYFHPLSENFLRGESEVIEKLRTCVATRLNYVIALQSHQLLKLLGSHALHKRLNEEQAGLLMAIPDADAKSFSHWYDVMRRVIKKSADSAFVKVYIRRSGTHRGETYSRVGIITFPFYTALINGEFDSSLRIKDRLAFKKLMEFMFPGIDQRETYNYGTKTQVAPNLDALMSSTSLVARRLNDITETYWDYLENPKDMMFDLDWVASFQDMDSLRPELRKMPELRGNAGKVTVSERQHPSQNIVNEPAKASVHKPIYEDEKPAKSVAQTQVLPTHQATYPTYPPVPPPVIAQPQVVQQHPGYTQPPQASQIKTPEGKINFSAALRAAPGLMYANAQAASGMLPQVPMVQVVAPNGQVIAVPANQVPMQQGMMPMQQMPMQQMSMQQIPQGFPPPPQGFTYQLTQSGQYVLVPISGMQPMMAPMQPVSAAAGYFGAPQTV